MKQITYLYELLQQYEIRDIAFHTSYKSIFSKLGAKNTCTTF